MRATGHMLTLLAVAAGPVAPLAAAPPDPAAVLGTPLQATSFSWRSLPGKAFPTLPAFTDSICLLTSVSGVFAGGGEKVSLDYGNDGKGMVWRLTGMSGQKPELLSSVGAGANCVSRKQFYVKTGSSFDFLIELAPGHSGGSCAPATFDDYYQTGYGAAFLTSLSGRFSGKGERVAIATGNPARMTINACSKSVTARTLKITPKVFKPPVYATMGGLTRDAAKATVTLAPTGTSGRHRVPLAPYDSAICGLVDVSGKFMSGFEQVAITKSDINGKPFWSLFIQSETGDQRVSASARCLARDQRAQTG